MKIHDQKRFGTHLMLLRKNAGITLDQACAKMGMDKKMYAAIEAGKIGVQIDDALIDEWMDWLPAFSPATAPGVTEPPLRRSDLERFEDGKPPPDRDRILRRGAATPQPGQSGFGAVSDRPYQGLDDAFRGWKPTG